MSWIKIENSHQLPRNGEQFLALWKGKISLCQFDIDEDRFYIQFDPVELPSFQLPQSRENKFTHWMRLPSIPKDY